MASRRPKPEGFDENLDELVALQQQREALDARIDDLYIAVSTGGPTATIAERLQVIPSTVANRRAQALRRQQLRQEDQRTTRAA
jgi:hypothetical protein